MIILGKNPGVVTNKSNTIVNNEKEFMVAKTFKLANIRIDDEHFDKEDGGSDTHTASENESEIKTGWVAKKYRSTIPEIGCTTTEFNKTKTLPGHDYMIPSWINHLSYGGLIIPSDYFKKIIFRAEQLFNKFTKYQVPKGSNLMWSPVEEKFKKVILTYIKQRIIILMKYFNYNNQLLKQKRKTKIKFQQLNKLRKL
ncbi:THAP-type domain-containing protein [Aphis craccivora]|uniref:THAP-type domain-containing protein n=1 Tax=Aphis craccivora TaxID=307492 RepID=A0A6G0YQI1_APHCR|nr:THAP-type domain-containing protein [Aphis craccivora]